MSLTVEDQRGLIESTIRELYPRESYPYVRDFDSTKAFVNVSGKIYQFPYTISKEGGVKLGTPTEVVAKTTYVGVKSINKGKRIGGAK